MPDLPFFLKKAENNSIRKFVLFNDTILMVHL